MNEKWKDGADAVKWYDLENEFLNYYKAIENLETRPDAISKKEYEFLQKAFDKHFAPPPIVADLVEADEVVFFGHSLGENDSQYLKPFFESQSSTSCRRKKITFFTYDDKSVRELKRAINHLTGLKLSYFFSMNQVEMIRRVDDGQQAYTDFVKAHITADRIDQVIKPLHYD